MKKFYHFGSIGETLGREIELAMLVDRLQCDLFAAAGFHSELHFLAMALKFSLIFIFIT